ncbi:MAG: hypothetical protein JWM64_307 [Frankiales bacterium]|nr:hypothetical protein [Frankiales bacterium]
MPDAVRTQLRVVAVTPVSSMGGAEAMLLRVLEAGVRSGWHVTCVVPEGELAQRLAACGVTVVAGPGTSTSRGPRPVALAGLALRVARTAALLARLGEADALVVNGNKPLLPLPLLRPGCAVVYYAHDVPTDGSAGGKAWSLGSGSVDLAVAVSEAVAAPLSRAGLPTIVVRNGTPAQDEPSRDDPEPPFLVGCNAALTPWKGQDVLLEAVAQLPHHVVVELLGRTFPGRGDQRYAAALRARSDRPDLRGRVRFLGHAADPLAVMRRWRVAVSASVQPEASGLAVLEAMSLGLPQVCTDHGGPPEVLGAAGLLVPPGDVGALVRALTRLLEDQDAWRAAQEEGPRAVQDWTVERQCAQFVAAVEGAAHRGRLSGRSWRGTEPA